jgi:hypothetical protein
MQEPVPVTWLLFVDDLHLDFRNTGRIRDLVRRVVKQLPAEGEAVAMFSSGPSNVSMMPTTDRILLDGQVKRLTGSGLKADDLQASGSRREVQYRAGMARSRLLELIGRVGGEARAIVYISNGYLTGASAPLKMEVSPPIFAIDPRPLMAGADLDQRTNWPDDYWTATRASLRAIAEASGGFAQDEGQSLDDALARITQVMRR